MPKVFIRQKLNSTTNKSVREVVDGQQRLRTILSFLQDGFAINKKHNREYGGLFFSQLNAVDEDAQANILNYEVAADLLVNMPDPAVLDVFGRLNSYSVVLNEQEKLHAEHFGPFKTLAESIAHQHYDFWIRSKILSEMQVLRMGDTTLVSDILIAMIEGIKSKKQIKSLYLAYEKSFDYDTEKLGNEFDVVMKMIVSLFGENFRSSNFHRVHIFYTLFTALYHGLFGMKDLPVSRPKLYEGDFPKLRIRLGKVDQIFEAEDTSELGTNERQFLEDSRRATTDASVRTRRTIFVSQLLTNS